MDGSFSSFKSGSKVNSERPSLIPHCPGSFSSWHPSLMESTFLKNYVVKKKEEEAEEEEEEGNLCQPANPVCL